MKKLKAIAAAGALLCASLTGCFFNEKEAFTDYVQSMLDCKYNNIQDKYMELTEATSTEAQELYDSMVEYLTVGLCDYCDVYYEYISDETYSDYQALAVRVLSKANYSVAEAVKSGDTYHITVTCEPMDFLDIIVDPVNEAIDPFMDRYAEYYDSDVEDLENDPEYLALEEDYAKAVLGALNGCVDSISYYSPQNIIVEIEDDGDYYGVSDKSWDDIDDLILGLDANASYE